MFSSARTKAKNLKSLHFSASKARSSEILLTISRMSSVASSKERRLAVRSCQAKNRQWRTAKRNLQERLGLPFDEPGIPHVLRNTTAWRCLGSFPEYRTFAAAQD